MNRTEFGCSVAGYCDGGFQGLSSERARELAEAYTYQGTSSAVKDVHVHAASSACTWMASSNSWTSPSTRALTQVFTRQVIREKQAVIHHLTLGWSVSQYLSHCTNPFASGNKYSLMAEADSSDQSPTLSDASSGRVHQTAPNCTRSTQYSLNGIARFLDSFADVYGNPSSKAGRLDARGAFEAVTHAWSTQWLYTADTRDEQSMDLWNLDDTLVRAAQH